MRCAIIDHDSIFFSLCVEFFREFDPLIIHHSDFDAQTVEKIENCDFVVLSGGPIQISGPSDITAEKEWIRKTNIPILGICLGHQILAVVFGVDVTELDIPREGMWPFEIFGRKGLINYKNEWHFKDVPLGFAELRRENEMIVAMQHETRPIFSIQGHPEVSGEYGIWIKKEFIKRFVNRINAA